MDRRAGRPDECSRARGGGGDRLVSAPNDIAGRQEKYNFKSVESTAGVASWKGAVLRCWRGWRGYERCFREAREGK